MEFTKEYGGVEYVVVETIAGKNKRPRGTRQKTVYLNEITKKASGKALHPTSFSKNFTRTESVNPISAFIKKNHAEEAKKIAKSMRDDKQGLVAPNDKPSHLSPELWVAVRLKSFKNWFGDWENDPANASKVVDENGEPRVVYHGSLQWFQIFNDGKERLNTAKAHRWMVVRGLQLPTKTKLSAGSDGRILTPEDLVKYKFATEQSFPLSGRGMIDAVDLGVMAREGQMQRLVSYARKNPASARLAGFFSADREGFEPSVRF